MRLLPRIFIVALLIFQLYAVFSTLHPNLVFAQTPNCSDPNSPTSLACIPVFLSNISNQAVIFASIAAVFFVAFAGIKFITSGGDPGKVESAKKTMTFAIIGLIIILLAYTTIKVVARVTNTNCKTIGLSDCK